MFKIKRKNIVACFLFIFMFFTANIFIPSNIKDYTLQNNIVYASPRGGFHSGSFSSHSSSSSGGFKSGSFSNSHSSSSKSSKSGLFGGSSNKGSSSSYSQKRSYIPIPIPIFGHHYYGGSYGMGSFFVFRIIKFILFIIVVIFIYRFIKKMRR
ncbi:amino acid permease [Clostridium sp. CT7]|nr:amino acid permease [Clostridium sp. CT7]